jgi:hypothetical protein
VRAPADSDRVRAFARELGRGGGRARVYLVGGATAVIEGWRATTADIDVRIEPDSDELLRRLPAIKEALGVNIELASPADFLPQLPGWRDRSPFLFREGAIDVHHYDLYSQALAKLERGLAYDMQDVASMVASGAVRPGRLAELLEAVADELYRFPAVDPHTLRRAVRALQAPAG